MSDGKGIDDDVALRTLIAFHGVDADVEEFRPPEPADFLAYQGYLAAIGYDDADGLLHGELLPVALIDFRQELCCQPGFGQQRVGAVPRGSVDKAKAWCVAFFLLMGQRHGLQLLAGIEHVRGPGSNGRMHPAMTVEDSYELGAS